MRAVFLALAMLFASAGAGCFVLFKDPEGMGGAGGQGSTVTTVVASTSEVSSSAEVSSSSESAVSVGAMSSSTGSGCSADTMADAMNCGTCGHVCLDTLTCTQGACDRNVFITANDALLDGAVGGVAGADSVCQKAATKAGLAGQYVAWVSLPGSDAIDRIFPTDPSHKGRIVNEGQLVANDVASMQAGLMTSIARNAANQTYGGANVLTNTGPDGRALGDACSGLLSTSGSNACVGVLVKTSPGWTNVAPTCGWSCGAKIYQLYCFEK